MWLLEQFPPGYSGYAVELGACDGTFISNTRLLEEQGWTVLCIEPNPLHQEALRKTRKLVFQCACNSAPEVLIKMWDNTAVSGRTQTSVQKNDGWIEFEATVLTLDQCLMIAGFPRLDVLSLDVDGIEREIIDGFNIDKWRPRAVIIEGYACGRLEPFLSRGYTQIGIRADDNRLLLRAEGL
jgi:FkbM family methyltransferase